MKRRSKNPFLAFLLLLVLSCLLVYPPSPPPPHHPSFSSMPRSLRLGSQHPTTTLNLKLTSSQEMNLGRPEARMDVEVKDYPTPGANDDHDPGHGRV